MEATVFNVVGILAENAHALGNMGFSRNLHIVSVGPDGKAVTEKVTVYAADAVGLDVVPVGEGTVERMEAADRLVKEAQYRREQRARG